MTQQRQSLRDSHAIRGANEHRESERESPHREHRTGDRTDRGSDESENPIGVLAELRWGREG